MSEIERLKSIDPTLPSAHLMAIVRVIWKGVVPRSSNLVRFLMAGGVDALFDIIETGNTCQRPALLSLLADIFENSVAHKFFHEWRSSVTGETASDMLISIWREAEDMKGISKGGVVANTERPLAGTGNRIAWEPKVIKPLGSPPIVFGIYESNDRAKVLKKRG